MANRSAVLYLICSTSCVRITKDGESPPSLQGTVGKHWQQASRHDMLCDLHKIENVASCPKISDLGQSFLTTSFKMNKRCRGWRWLEDGKGVGGSTRGAGAGGLEEWKEG